MASLEIYEKATSPYYSASGSSILVGIRSGIYTKWHAAVMKYMSDAKASSTAELGVWTPTGTIHTGTTAPATPANQSGIPFGACGSGSSGAALAAGGTAAISYKFYNSTATAEYRWVEDRPYIAPGSWYSAGLTLDICRQGLADATYGSIPTPTASNPYDAGNELISYLNSAAPPGTVYTSSAPCPVGDSTISSYGYNANTNPDTLQMLINMTPGSAIQVSWVIARFIKASEQLGRWHLERRLSTPVMGATSCATAEYISSSAPDFDPATSPNKTTVRLNAIHAAGIKGPYMNIGQACGSTDIVTAYDSLAGLNTLYPDPIPGYNKEGAYHPAVDFNYITPGSTFFLQQGSYTMGYNDLEGAYVFDMQLKKWGKYKHTYKCLVPFYAENYVNTSLFQYDDLGMSAGLLHADGKVYAFDHVPSEGYIKYGKIGYYRLGNCHFLEARIDFRSFATGILTIDSSLDGRYVDPAVTLSANFDDELTCRVYPNIRAKWVTLKVSGKYDLQYMEIRGNISGRR